MAIEGKRIVLTGVTRGLGAALTESFVEAGHAVAGCGRNEKAILELRRRFGGPHDFAVVDVAHEADVRAWIDRLLVSFGAPDLLINNAGLINANAPLWEVPSNEFDAVIDVNVKGVANVLRAALPAMVALGSGVIVNFSSTWGRSTSPEVAPYCATKWAIEGLTKALANELPKGMAAVPFNPGVIDTDMLRQCFGSSAGAYPKADEWSRSAAPFLLSLGPRHNGVSVTAPE